MCHMTYVFVCVEVPVHCVSVCPVCPGSLHVSFYGNELIRLAPARCSIRPACSIRHTPVHRTDTVKIPVFRLRRENDLRIRIAPRERVLGTCGSTGVAEPD